MTLLKDMIEDIIGENEDSAKVNFHSYLTGKMQNLTENKSNTVRVPNDKAEEFLNAADKLFKAEFKPNQGDFYTTIEVIDDIDDEFNAIESMADDFK